MSKPSYKHLLALDTPAKKMILAENVKLPKGKRFTQESATAEVWTRVVKQLDKLDLKGKPLSTSDVASVTRIAGEILECDSSLVRPLIQEFLDVFMNSKTLDLLAWQIAGNRKIIKERAAVLFNNRQNEKCWTAGTITDVVTCSSSKFQYAKIKLLEGPAAGFTVYARLPDRNLRKLSYVLGVAKKGYDKRMHGMVDIRQCVLMKVLVYLNGTAPLYRMVKGVAFNRLDQNTSTEVLSWLRITPNQKKHNKALYDLRSTPCPYGYTNTCYDCIVGYTSCNRGCRPATIPKPNKAAVVITIKGKNLCQKILEEV